MKEAGPDVAGCVFQRCRGWGVDDVLPFRRGPGAGAVSYFFLLQTEGARRAKTVKYLLRVFLDSVRSAGGDTVARFVGGYEVVDEVLGGLGEFFGHEAG